MAKIVIAGEANCPYYAKIELLADSLKKNLPDFKLHKIVKHPNEWESWLSDVCSQRGFRHQKSPIVWRELVDRGGKGLLIGGANEFQEYVNGYYGLTSDFTSNDITKMAGENLKTKDEIDSEEKAMRELVKPVHVCITNASSGTCYNLMESMAKGEALGPNTDISIHLLDTDDNLNTLEGLRMEMFDLACPLLRDVTLTSDPDKAFSDCSLIIILDDIEREKKENDAETGDGDTEKGKSASNKTENVDSLYSESKEDWLKRNHEHFVNYAKVINDKANRDVKVVVGGNGPVNFNTNMMLQHMPNISRQNIVAVSRLIENHAKSVIAERLKVNTSDVVDVTIWGQSYDKYYLDISKARVHHYNGAIWDKWLQGEFMELVMRRRDEIETALGRRAAASHAAAVLSLVNHWWNSSPHGQVFSLGVQSEGWYGVPEGLVFSFPVTFHPAGYWSVAQDIDLTEEAKQQIDAVVKDLLSEKEVIYPSPREPSPSPPPQDLTQTSEQTEDVTTNTAADPEEIPVGEDGPSLGRIAEDPEGEIAASEITGRVSADGSQKAPSEKDADEPTEE